MHDYVVRRKLRELVGLRVKPPQRLKPVQVVVVRQVVREGDRLMVAHLFVTRVIGVMRFNGRGCVRLHGYMCEFDMGTARSDS